MANDEIVHDKLIEGEHNYETITDRIGRIVMSWQPHGKGFYALLGIGFLFINVLMLSIGMS